jgi:hypothetical protein
MGLKSLLQRMRQARRTRSEDPEGALRRGLVDTQAAAGHWWFRGLVFAGSIGFAVWGALLPTSASGGEHVALAVGGVVGGAVVVGLGVLIILTATAPTRQRDDLRQGIKQRTDAAVQEDELAKAKCSGSEVRRRIRG